jgi:sugar phosphate isomerase/epimerase
LNLSEDKDQVRFIKKAGKRLKALHLADNDGTSDQHLMPTAKGQVDFQAVIKALHDVNYDGLYNFEVPGERDVPLGHRGLKLEYMRDLLHYYWEHC